jgi:hypothetical protein
LRAWNHDGCGQKPCCPAYESRNGDWREAAHETKLIGRPDCEEAYQPSRNERRSGATQLGNHCIAA